MLTKSTAATEVGDILDLAQSFRRSLLAANRSPLTVTTYMTALNQLHAYLTAQGMPTNVASITREHLESFIANRLETFKPATVSIRYKGIQQFMKWCLDEGEIENDPMAKMSPPHIPEMPVAVLSDDDLSRLLKACNGKTFEDVRDLAILRLLLDTGMRIAELTGLNLDSIDLDNNVAVVLGKGRRPRMCPFGAKTSQAIDRYQRARKRHRLASDPALWIGQRGRLNPQGVRERLIIRAEQAGLGHIHPHMFRHTFAHRWLSNGNQEQDLMRIGGWRSREVMARYGAVAADERAREAHKRAALGDKL